MGGWPSARLVLFGADGRLAETLRALRVSATVPLAPDQSTARLLLQRRPSILARRLDLANELSSPRRARLFVTTACRDWQLDSVCDDAVIVASELVENAVVHAPDRVPVGHPVGRPRVDHRGSRFRAVHRATSAARPRAVHGRRGEPGMGRQPDRGRQERVGPASDRGIGRLRARVIRRAARDVVGCPSAGTGRTRRMRQRRCGDRCIAGRAACCQRRARPRRGTDAGIRRDRLGGAAKAGPNPVISARLR